MLLWREDSSDNSCWITWRRSVVVGLPAPQPQYRIYTPEGRAVARCDFGWPQHGLVGEFDGMVKYGRLLKPGQDVREVVLAEKRREENIRRCGWWIVRWGERDLHDPQGFAALITDGFSFARPR